MRLQAWHVAGLLTRASSSLVGHHHLLLAQASGGRQFHRPRDSPAPMAIGATTGSSTRRAPRSGIANCCAFLPPRPLFLSSPFPRTATTSSSSSCSSNNLAVTTTTTTTTCFYRRHRGRQPKTWLPSPALPSSRTGGTRNNQNASSALVVMSGIILPDNGNNNNNSPLLEAASSGVSGGGGGDGGIALWLDMRTAALPAAQTLKAMYDDLRQREESLGRGPDDPDWSLSRVPNPVGALLYAAEPAERALEEMKALGGGGGGGGGGLPCFRLSDTDEAKILDVSSGDVAGVGLDPGGGGGSGGNQAAELVAAAQQAGCGSLVLLGGVRPSVWEGGDMGTVLRIAASACAGAGKTLVVTVRSVGQLHDAAMAAFAASQTQVLGGRPASGEGASEGSTPVMALLIEPMADLWEAGLLYL